jgi:dienelactone hydrolase
MAAASRVSSRFFEHDDINFVFLIVLGGAYDHVADVGACLAIADGIKDGDPGSAYEAFAAAGERLAVIADTAAAASRRISAREAYLQAANYTFAATYFADAMGAPERFAPTWLRHQALWDAGAALLDPPMERVRIRYEDTTLPGYFFRVDDTGRARPLLILNNGSDGGMVAAWTLGAAAALARGYNALTFYGPGQGRALLEQKLYFRPDWEKVIAPVIDYALGRPEVDPERIALLGISQGGYWVPRAVAFEPRIAAAVADPGVFDVAAAWTGHLPPPMLELLDAGAKDQFDGYMAEGMKEDPEIAARLAFRMRPFGSSSPYEVFKAAQQYTLAGVAEKIRCPMLITDPEGEAFWPGQSQQLYEALRCPKTLVRFSAAEGGDLHCEPKAPGLRAQRIFDWLDATLDGVDRNHCTRAGAA